MADVIARVGRCTLEPRAEWTHFDALVRSIVYQQLSGKAAATIHGRVLTLIGDGGFGGCFPDIPCKASGQLIGRNTVSQINLEMLGIGRFEGVLRESGTMRGIFAVSNSYDTITFNRTSTTISANRVTGK